MASRTLKEGIKVEVKGSNLIISHIDEEEDVSIPLSATDKFCKAVREVVRKDKKKHKGWFILESVTELKVGMYVNTGEGGRRVSNKPGAQVIEIRDNWVRVEAPGYGTGAFYFNSFPVIKVKRSD